MPRYVREFITPQVAREMMSRNAANQRNLKWHKIPGYARDMRTGDWNDETGETLKITPDGIVIDGQNRLQAVIEAGEGLPNGGVWFDIAYDVPMSAMLVIDSGSARTAADAMIVTGAPDRNNASSVVRWVIMVEAGNPMGRNAHQVQPTHSEIVKRFNEDPQRFSAAVLRGRDLRRSKIGSFRPAGVAYYLFAQVDPEANHQFFDQLVSGANIPLRSAVLVLRNRLIKAADDRVSPAEQLALFVRAWNHFRAGKPIGNLIISKDGKLSNDNFPKIK